MNTLVKIRRRFCNPQISEQNKAVDVYLVLNFMVSIIVKHLRTICNYEIFILFSTYSVIIEIIILFYHVTRIKNL